MAYMVYDVREYFEGILALSGKSVLDWGCNHGNFLLSGGHDDYTGVDIDLEVIEGNRITRPNYKWIHYDTYNAQYNCKHTGNGQWPKLEKYDVIIIFSVFTHTDEHEMAETVDRLRNHLKPNGKIALTYFSLDDSGLFSKIIAFRPEMNLSEYIYDRIQFDDNCAIMATPASSMLFRNMIHLPKPQKPMYTLVFYKDEYIRNLLGGEIISPPTEYGDIRSSQKCIIIGTREQ